MTVVTSYFDDEVAARADEVTDAAIVELLLGDAVINVANRSHHVVVVAAPAGAGKSYFVCTAAERAVAAHPGGSQVIAIASPTNEQAYALVRTLAGRLDVPVAFVPASKRNLPADVAALPNVVEIKASEAGDYPVIVGTLAKLGNAYGRGDLYPGWRYLCIDEAYQAESAQYYGVAHLADRHLLVGDPGQLDPFTTMDDPDRWRGLAEDPTQTAVAALLRHHPQVPVHRVPITRRLPVSALPIARAFYPGHEFSSWTVPDARQLRVLPPADDRTPLDDIVDLAAAEGWAYVRLPHTPVLTADPATIETITAIVGRLLGRQPEVRSERTDGRWTLLGEGRVAVVVSHNDQKDHLRVSLDTAGLEAVRVDTANKLQGLEFDLLVAWHPLAGLPETDGFHLDAGRLCVMLTRHRHACIVVGRAGDADLLADVPPASDAWLGHDSDPELDGWFAQRIVFDQLERVAVDL